MADPESPHERQRSLAEDVSHDAFSSEKREDIWALLIAGAIFLLSVTFPTQMQSFFSSVLVLF